uniref:Polyprotein n=2 Tax=Oryza sativa subsp. japonica TaxID=39947 RepID=A0A5S6R8J8_ORYSJ|nr:Putative polyprotein [Oryza sativa Japonica Group]AAP53496.1 transposon protein, putative, unclassified [Oryza sativa Japonica Group]
MSWHRAGVLLLGAQSCLPVPGVPAVGGIGSVLLSMARMGWKLCHVFRLYTVVHLSNLVAVPSLSHENHYFLGPIGNLDPTEVIIGETNRIPSRLANPSLGHWKNTFKSWPSLEKTLPEKSWVIWYKRVSASKQTHWDEIGIGQALALTIANSAKDEPLMAAPTYVWSNTINAFLFNQGPMTSTLVDITMITGLDVTSSANPMSLNTKNQYDFRTKSIGG